MPPTAVLREPSPASLIGWGETETSFRRAFVDVEGDPMSATLTTAQLGRACLPQRDLLQRRRQGRPLRRLGGAGDLRQ
jgi:hypothetical protein